MYIRFVTDQRDPCARSLKGVFRSDIPTLPRSDWRLSEIDGLYRWFNHNLCVPDRFVYRPGRKAERWGVCWFRPQAKASISNARYLAWLLGDIGCPVLELRADCPGEVLWRDAQQVVALPLRG